MADRAVDGCVLRIHCIDLLDKPHEEPRSRGRSSNVSSATFHPPFIRLPLGYWRFPRSFSIPVQAVRGQVVRPFYSLAGSSDIERRAL
jgi:hypothetical protein